MRGHALANFDALPLAANVLLFTLAAVGVRIAGSRLSLFAEAISDRKRIGKALMGLVFLTGGIVLPLHALAAARSICSTSRVRSSPYRTGAPHLRSSRE